MWGEFLSSSAQGSKSLQSASSLWLKQAMTGCVCVSYWTDSLRPVTWRRTVSRPAIAVLLDTLADAVKGKPSPLSSSLFPFLSLFLSVPSGQRSAFCGMQGGPALRLPRSGCSTIFFYKQKGYKHVCGWHLSRFFPVSGVSRVS